jgi:hypothetical protein
MEEFSEQSRVWIYQSDRVFDSEEVSRLNMELNLFVQQWTAHNVLMKATGQVLFNRFLVLVVDENQAGASGCSIDKSVHFMQTLEKAYGVNLFDRMIFAYKLGDEVHFAKSNVFADLYKSGKINDQTPVFDNLVTTLADLKTSWIKPLSSSWHKRFV